MECGVRDTGFPKDNEVGTCDCVSVYCSNDHFVQPTKKASGVVHNGDQCMHAIEI